MEIVDDYQVVFQLKQAAPEFVETISANTDLVIESKARWDAGGKELYGQKVVGTGPFEFVERKVGSHVLYKRVENHWRKTPEYKEFEFRWVPEGVTRLATLLAEEMHISDVDAGPAEGCGGQGDAGPRRANCRPSSTSGFLVGCTLPARTSWTPRCPLWTSGCGRP